MAKPTSEKRAPGSRPAVDRGIPVVLVDALINLLAIDEEEITLDSKLFDDLGADSLDVVELGMELEEHLETEISDAHIDTWVHVKDVMATLTKLGARG